MCDIMNDEQKRCDLKFKVKTEDIKAEWIRRAEEIEKKLIAGKDESRAGKFENDEYDHVCARSLRLAAKSLVGDEYEMTIEDMNRSGIAIPPSIIQGAVRLPRGCR